MFRYAALVLCLLATAAAAQADTGGGTGFAEGRWRLQLSGMHGADSGDRIDRTGDRLFTANAEYEFPITRRQTLALRIYPALFYDAADSDNVWGAGGGLSWKIYSKAGEQRGVFAEAATAAIFHDETFAGNGGHIDFLSGLGIGYHFANDWHLSVKWEHISNAGLEEPNQGINLVGLAVGVTF